MRAIELTHGMRPYVEMNCLLLLGFFSFTALHKACERFDWRVEKKGLACCGAPFPHRGPNLSLHHTPPPEPIGLSPRGPDLVGSPPGYGG